MNKRNQQAVKIALAALIGGGALLPIHTPASAASIRANVTIDQAVAELFQKGVLQGEGNGQLHAQRHLTNAEFIKMVVLALDLKQDPAASQLTGKWYSPYVQAAIHAGLMEKDADFDPNRQMEGTQLAPVIAKALQRDAKSVQYWMDGLKISQAKVTRGEAAQLLIVAGQAVRSGNAQIESVRALNKITLEVTLDHPMTIEDETTAAAQSNFVFDNGLKLVNQPRLKTGSIATYILPVVTMKPGTEYTLVYKGKQTFKVAASGESIQLKGTRQVTNDTFEVDSLREDGVIDYGYIISAYAGGRGANAIVLEQDNKYKDKAMQIISSLATRQATLTPEGGAPITVNYVGFTQSTDGKQEPKFRLPSGTTLKEGVKYSVTSDWFELADNTFIAHQIEPLKIASAANIDGVSISVSLSADPGDELFAYRSVQLKAVNGEVLTAQYRVQTRKGETGVFDILNGGKLAAGTTYEVIPVGDWAVADKVELEMK